MDSLAKSFNLPICSLIYVLDDSLTNPASNAPLSLSDPFL